MINNFYAALYKSSNPICLYHASDMDGFGAAYVVQKVYRLVTNKQLECHPYTYSDQDDKLLKLTSKHDFVVFLDVAPVNVDICKKLPQIWILDHHTTTANKYENCPKNVHYIFAPVPTCWQVYHPMKDLPKLTQLKQVMSLLALYDVDIPDSTILEWDIDTDLYVSNNAKYVTYGLRAVTGMRDFDRFELYYIHNLLKFGKIAYNYARTTVKLIKEKYGFQKKMKGQFEALNNYKCISFNCPNIALPISSILYDEDFDVVITFVTTPNKNFSVNMFSKQVNLLELVPGSTGHPHEASVTIEALW